jgi:hypothetical protein
MHYEALWGSSALETLRTLEENDSDDELDIAAHLAVDQHFGDPEA